MSDDATPEFLPHHARPSVTVDMVILTILDGGLSLLLVERGGPPFQGQLALLSDKNFLEQYYKNEFDLGPNQETFAYLAWQRRNFGATALVQDRLARSWVGEAGASRMALGRIMP